MGDVWLIDGDVPKTILDQLWETLENNKVFELQNESRDMSHAMHYWLALKKDGQGTAQTRTELVGIQQPQSGVPRFHPSGNKSLAQFCHHEDRSRTKYVPPVLLDLNQAFLRVKLPAKF